MDAHGI